MTVYVVGWAPSDERAATGGFEWFFAPEQAVSYAARTLREIGLLGAHSVTFTPLAIPDEVAYPGEQTVVDTEAVTAWINANLHLVEVGLDPSPDSNDGGVEDISHKFDDDEPSARCIVHGCGEPADGEGKIEFALPGERTVAASVCRGHREMLADTSPSFSKAESPGESLSVDTAETVDRVNLAVWKYPLSVQDEVEVEMPTGARILAVQEQGGNPMLWVQVNPRLEERVVRRFRIVGTGHVTDAEKLRYVGTFQLAGGTFVGHVFERMLR